MITKIVLSSLGVIAGWIAILATVMVLSDDSPAALVMFPDAAFLAGLPDGISITSQNAISVTLTSQTPDIARVLYHAGATLVLPAGLLGCAPLTS